ncbi:MAG TPA: hypothetical protein VLI71_14330, partial [Gammaproteobacteria bacterium]|nr:hypothetical protein [Gammaproteobacteria bacterium]
MTWLRRGAILLSAVVVLALAGVAGVLWVAGTDGGTAWLMRRLLAGAPSISIERVRGSLLGGLRLEGVRLRTPRDELDIDSLDLDWNAAALLAGVLAFEHADAGRAIYRRVPDVTAPGGQAPELPWPLRVDEGSVATLSITVLERTLVFRSTTFAGAYGDRRLELTDVAGAVG